jgi:hypothetical protein
MDGLQQDCSGALLPASRTPMGGGLLRCRHPDPVGQLRPCDLNFGGSVASQRCGTPGASLAQIFKLIALQEADFETRLRLEANSGGSPNPGLSR